MYFTSTCAHCGPDLDELPCLNGQNMWQDGFQTLNSTGGWWQREEKQEVSPQLPLVLQAKCREEKTKQSPVVNLRWGKTWEGREGQSARVCRMEIRQERAAEGSPQAYSWSLVGACMWRKYPQTKDKDQEQKRRNNSQTSFRAGNCSHSPQLESRNLKICGHWAEYSEKYCPGSATKLILSKRLCWSPNSTQCKSGKKKRVSS